MTWAWIGLAGAAGTLLRHALNQGLLVRFGASWPYGTFAANVIGSFALGAVMELVQARAVGGVPLRLVLGTGLLGGFTTYSSFNLEAIRFAEQGAWSRAGVYIVATLCACLVAGLLGVLTIRALRT